jgi:hypothetical protein
MRWRARAGAVIRTTHVVRTLAWASPGSSRGGGGTRVVSASAPCSEAVVSSVLTGDARTADWAVQAAALAPAEDGLPLRVAQLG